MQRMENKIKAFILMKIFQNNRVEMFIFFANSKHSLNLSKEEYTKRELSYKKN